MAQLTIREVRSEEFETLGQLLVDVYSQLDGFPKPHEQPRYFEMLANIGTFSEKKDAKLLVALTSANEIVGGVVYFGDMAEYGSGGTATRETDASGIRLLAVSPVARGMGVGKALTDRCIQLAHEKGHRCVVLHTTQAMKVAWCMYEKLGFRRAEDLDFMQEALQVYGFRLALA